MIFGTLRYVVETAWDGGDEMFSVLVSCAVDRGFEPQSAQIKDYENGICVASQQ